MSGILDTYPRARKAAYLAYALGGVALGATQVGYGAADASTPTWLTVTLAVFAFVGTGLGLTAASNVPDGKPPKVIDLLEPPYSGEHRAAE